MTRLPFAIALCGIVAAPQAFAQEQQSFRGLMGKGYDIKAVTFARGESTDNRDTFIVSFNFSLPDSRASNTRYSVITLVSEAGKRGSSALRECSTCAVSMSTTIEAYLVAKAGEAAMAMTAKATPVFRSDETGENVFIRDGSS